MADRYGIIAVCPNSYGIRWDAGLKIHAAVETDLPALSNDYAKA
jgi:hypothetical protein